MRLKKRKLRRQEGFNIITYNDRNEFKPGQHLLVDRKIKPFFERGISKEARAFVMDRNRFTCQICGIVGGGPHSADGGRKARLHIAHIVNKSMAVLMNREI